MLSGTSLHSLVASLRHLNDRQGAISDEISSGVRISALSDDASAAGRSVTMADVLRRDDAFIATATTVGSQMQAADTVLASVVNRLTSAISTAIGGLSDSALGTARLAAVQQLLSIRDGILSLANSSYSGTYLFSGTGTSVPFADDGSGSIIYSGTNDTSRVSLPAGGTLQNSLAGSSVFLAAGASVFGALDDAIAALQSGNTTGAATIAGQLRSALDAVTGQRAVLNAAQNRLSNESSYVSSQKTNVSADQSTLLSADMASLATELSAVTTQQSALLSTISIVEKGSLFDYL
jgi:flagellar hook-associated protein 3 FlgL